MKTYQKQKQSIKVLFLGLCTLIIPAISALSAKAAIITFSDSTFNDEDWNRTSFLQGNAQVVTGNQQDLRTGTISSGGECHLPLHMAF